jgi:hypothetical protein
MRLILHTETGDVFVKGIGPDGGDIERGDLDLGAELAPFVPASPSLSFKGQADGWVFTGWQAVEGRQASMKPGSDDIPLMVGLLAELGQIEAPDVPGLRTAGKDWGGGAPTLSGGHMLVHTDPHGGNFIVQPDQIWMIDLGHAVRGPGWLTSARFILYLMRAGGRRPRPRPLSWTCPHGPERILNRSPPMPCPARRPGTGQTTSTQCRRCGATLSVNGRSTGPSWTNPLDSGGPAS